MNRNDRNLLTLFLSLPLLVLTGCDVDAMDDPGGGDLECPEGQICEDEAPLEPTEAQFHWLIILDNSTDENLAGTPGVDICGVELICDGRSYRGVEALLHPGAGEMCTERGPSCGAARNVAAAALDRGAACSADSSPISDYVSLGIGGVLAIRFDRDLRGCEVHVVEHQGRDRESFEAYVCQDGSFEACLTDAPTLEGRFGGSVSGDVPAARE